MASPRTTSGPAPRRLSVGAEARPVEDRVEDAPRADRRVAHARRDARPDEQRAARASSTGRGGCRAAASPWSPSPSPWSPTTTIATRSRRPLLERRARGAPAARPSPRPRRGRASSRSGCGRARAARRGRAGRSSGPRGRAGCAATPARDSASARSVVSRAVRSARPAGSVVVVDVEPAGEAEAARQDEARDEGGRAVAGLPQPLGQDGVLAGEVARVLVDAVPRRVEARHHRACEGSVSGTVA